MSMNKKLIVIELNEFNRELLGECAKRFQLKNLAQILQLKETKTFSVDTYESDYLEPWSQWVTVHTGQRSSQHLIKHLGDVSSLKFSQVWEQLSEQGVRTGVWGAINGTRGQAQHCEFFVPDPWTFCEGAYPSSLSYLVDLPRYMAKNRKNLKLLKIIPLFFGFLKIFLNWRVLLTSVLRTPRVLAQIFRDGPKEYVLFSFFEALSAIEFTTAWKRTQPQVAFLFLNTMAHIQHYYWDLNDSKNASRFRYAMTFIDEMIGQVLALGTEIVMYNGLSQTSTKNDAPWISYRPIDHDDFLEFLGVAYERVEPLMSYDAILLLKSSADVEKARQKLSALRVNGQPLLLVENYKEDPLRLFYRLAFTDPVPQDTMVVGAGMRFQFFDQITPITTRTGKHIPEGNLFSSLAIFPELIENTQVMGILSSQHATARDSVR